MNLWLRLFILMLWLRRQPKIDLLDEMNLDMRVLPNDLDISFHMNNGRYLSLMDLGRIALMHRVGVLKAARRNGWMPLVREIQIEYFKPLLPWRRFRLHTRVISWDAKWVYMEQRFTAGDKLHARAIVRGLLRGRDGNVPSAEVLVATGAKYHEPPEPPPAFGEVADSPSDVEERSEA